MSRALLERCQRELLNVLMTCNAESVYHDGDDFHELLGDIRAELSRPAPKPAAYMTEDGRVSTRETFETAMPRVAKESFKIPLFTQAP